MKIETLAFIVIGILLTVLIIITVNSKVDTVQQPEVVGTDLDYLNERFDKLEVGIQNSSIDFCLKNNGLYLTDANNNLIVTSVDVPVDQNAGLFRKFNTITCIFPAS